MTYIFGLLYGSTLPGSTAFIIYFKLVSMGEASKVASFTFLIPIIAVAAGTIFMGEPFTYRLLTGLMLIVISIYFVNRPVRKNKHQFKKSIRFQASK